jgi:hypothetical protein
MRGAQGGGEGEVRDAGGDGHLYAVRGPAVVANAPFHHFKSATNRSTIRTAQAAMAAAAVGDDAGINSRSKSFSSRIRPAN